MVTLPSCKVADCRKPAKNAGYCWSHYSRLSRYGSPLAGGPFRPFRGPTFQEARFWSKVERRGPAECWAWRASHSSKGYGQFYVDSKPVGAHRVAYELMRGPIPDGLELDHLCRNPGCVNPDHLEPVTRRMNSLRGKGMSAHNAAKTECAKGHSYDLLNTRFTKKGWRQCLLCETLAAQRKRKSALTP